MTADEKKEKECDEARMTFTGHLGELRTRIIRSGVAIGLGCLVCYILSEDLYQLIKKPLMSLSAGDGSADWQTHTLLENVFARLKLAGYGGIVLVAPYIAYQVCAFVFPGLKPKERRVVQVLLFGCTTFALLGLGAAYFFVVPLILNALEQFSFEGVDQKLQLLPVITEISKFLVAFAVAFQFPIVTVVMVYMGLLTPETLKRSRKVAIVGMAVAAAMLTPPDPMSMVMMLLPLALLYEGSIWVSYLVVRKKKASEES